MDCGPQTCPLWATFNSYINVYLYLLLAIYRLPLLHFLYIFYNIIYNYHLLFIINNNFQIYEKCIFSNKYNYKYTIVAFVQ